MVVYISIVFHSLWPWYLHSRYAKRVRGEVCLIVMLSRFEELDIIQQLEREVKDSAGRSARTEDFVPGDGKISQMALNPHN